MSDVIQVWQIAVEQPFYHLAGRKQEVRSIIAAVLNLFRLYANCTSSGSAESIRRFAPSPQRADWLWVSLIFLINGYQMLFLWDCSLPFVKLTIHCLLMPRSRKSGAKLQVSTRTGTALYYFIFPYTRIRLLNWWQSQSNHHQYTLW